MIENEVLLIRKAATLLYFFWNKIALSLGFSFQKKNVHAFIR